MATQCMNDDDDEEHGRGARCDRLDESEGESDLDGVVDGIRRLVAQEQSNIPGDLLTASVTKWLDTVYDRMRRAHGERDGDEEEDAVEVLSMLLSACVSSQWRRYIGIKDDPIGDFVFHMNNLTMVSCIQCVGLLKWFGRLDHLRFLIARLFVRLCGCMRLSCLTFLQRLYRVLLMIWTHDKISSSTRVTLSTHWVVWLSANPRWTFCLQRGVNLQHYSAG